ncbi:hypothetical protein NOS3756_31180 [Nostoc sp. NIES-3756]|uniref:hypothetical protein n=1 Tax=Nostoc sp. NIES-3756 TaxID=1751286 RepID=UPI00071EFDE3|nr:hypothetical protein [Nostoc sp. NIES-3756]BAT54153.1 hypothetical protein NOS3756_31180 [Nostoc sp. NIES-3756]
MNVKGIWGDEGVGGDEGDEGVGGDEGDEGVGGDEGDEGDEGVGGAEVETYIPFPFYGLWTMDYGLTTLITSDRHNSR